MSLWLALHFPLLPLEVFSYSLPPAQPLAVTDGQRIILCNAAAAECGIRPGLIPGAAYALAQQLVVTPRHPANEQAALESLALWAGQFTSHVSMEACSLSLVLEISGSLRLFGGMAALLQEVTVQTAALPHQSTAAVAPTPRAALLLARDTLDSHPAHAADDVQDAPPAHATQTKRQPRHTFSRKIPQSQWPEILEYQGIPCIQETRHLASMLAELPVGLLVDAGAVRKLRSLGVTTLGECLRLPKAGLGRRFGKDLVADLDRLLGHRADPRPRYQAPETFDRRLTLPAATANADALVFAYRRLVDELVVYLRVRVKGVQELIAQMFHREHCVTQFTLSLQRPTGEPSYLLELIREHLNRLVLPGPVEDIRLQATTLFALAAQTTDLFASHTPAMDWSELTDRLGARLGKDSITGLQTHADYRPEKSWVFCAPGTVENALAARETRPIWLLPNPIALLLRENHPYYQGPLKLLSPMERIETAWWDALGAARDYYLATTPGGSLLWIYRERRTRSWYLHGIFA